MRFFLLLSILLNSLLFGEFNYRLENSNIQINDIYSYNYNRLRLNIGYNEDAYFSTLIADAINYYGDSFTSSNSFELLKSIRPDTPVSLQSSFKEYDKGSVYGKIYRFYGGYEDDKNRLVAGLQNITMGVGRFWNPTNLFNPKNIYALEVDEIYGVLALSYTRYINDTTSLSVVSSIKDDKSLKYALRYKSFLEFGDVAIDAIYSDETKMVGYEIEANLADTGVELRSEGAYISSQLEPTKDKNEFFQAILGAEYGFVNGINLTFESLYSSKEFTDAQIFSNLNSEIIQNMTTSKLYAGMSLSYSFNIFLDGSVFYIESFDSYEPFSSVALNYTLNDYNSFTFGLMSQENETYYLKYQLAF